MKPINLLAASVVGTLLLGLTGATAASAAPVGQPPPATISPQLVGGDEASRRYSASAELLIGPELNFVCGATLVATHDSRVSRYAETNAQCVTEFPSSEPQPAALFHLRIGSRTRGSGGAVVGVTKVLRHADWSWGQGPAPTSDIAMLQLDRDVWGPFTIGSSLASPLRLIGFGSVEPGGGGPLADRLHELDTRRVSNALCEGITAGEFCVGRDGTGPCFGDAGSAALRRVGYRWVLVGSASRGGCVNGTPSIYTNTTFFNGWMRQVIRTGEVPPSTFPKTKNLHRISPPVSPPPGFHI